MAALCGQDREIIAIWREHGIPLDRTTVDTAAEIIDRLDRDLVEVLGHRAPAARRQGTRLRRLPRRDTADVAPVRGGVMVVLSTHTIPVWLDVVGWGAVAIGVVLFLIGVWTTRPQDQRARSKGGAPFPPPPPGQSSWSPKRHRRRCQLAGHRWFPTDVPRSHECGCGARKHCG